MTKHTNNAIILVISIFIILLILVYFVLNILRLIFIVFVPAIIVGTGLSVWFSRRNR